MPPYDAGKFPEQVAEDVAGPARPHADGASREDSYSHIHYDSAQARTISVREAARLQSFPDGFVFSGTMNPAFRQIGNAVPPLLAKAVGSMIYQALCKRPTAQGQQYEGASAALPDVAHGEAVEPTMGKTGMRFVILRFLRHNELGMFHAYRRWARSGRSSVRSTSTRKWLIVSFPPRRIPTG